ncbi:chitin deacetylase, partial [Irineochytrium annulatum]
MHPTYPSCDYSDSLKHIPYPPVVPKWVNYVMTHQDPDYPIPNTPPNAGGGNGLAPGGPSLSGIPWGDPKNKATELAACGVGQWAVTYDDGPGEHTYEFLNLLKTNNVPAATFFTIGGTLMNGKDNVQRLKAVYDAGHQVAIHTWTHPTMSTRPIDELISEVILTARAIYDAIGVVPRYFRPPYGDMDDRVRNMLLALGLRPV